MEDTRKFSFKDKIKQYLCFSFSCCFTSDRRETLHPESPSSTSNSTKRPLFLMGASSLPEIKHKCSNMFRRIGGSNCRPNHRRRRSSTDFRYDPISYALNFEEDACGNVEYDAQLKDFSSRLPSSPPTDHGSFLSGADV